MAELVRIYHILDFILQIRKEGYDIEPSYDETSHILKF